jgi:glycerol uptake facilitator-like aquaporin
MNPMLASAFAINKNFAINEKHVLVYWVAPLIGAFLAALAYVVYTGGEGAQFFGHTLKVSVMRPVRSAAVQSLHPNPLCSSFRYSYNTDRSS